MATLLRSSSRSSKVPQAASSLVRPPEPPAEQAAAKDRHVHGSAGRHQVATLPSSIFSQLFHINVRQHDLQKVVHIRVYRHISCISALVSHVLHIGTYLTILNHIVSY